MMARGIHGMNNAANCDTSGCRRSFRHVKNPGVHQPLIGVRRNAVAFLLLGDARNTR